MMTAQSVGFSSAGGVITIGGEQIKDLSEEEQEIIERVKQQKEEQMR